MTHHSLQTVYLFSGSYPAFNKFYAHTRILDESPERDSRLALSYATAVVLKESLRLLGVDAPEKM